MTSHSPWVNLNCWYQPAGTFPARAQQSFCLLVPDKLASFFCKNTQLLPASEPLDPFLPKTNLLQLLWAPYSSSVRFQVIFHIQVLRKVSLTARFRAAPLPSSLTSPRVFFPFKAFICTFRVQTLDLNCLSSNSSSAIYWLCSCSSS